MAPNDSVGLLILVEMSNKNWLVKEKEYIKFLKKEKTMILKSQKEIKTIESTCRDRKKLFEKANLHKEKLSEQKIQFEQQTKLLQEMIPIVDMIQLNLHHRLT